MVSAFGVTSSTTLCGHIPANTKGRAWEAGNVKLKTKKSYEFRKFNLGKSTGSNESGRPRCYVMEMASKLAANNENNKDEEMFPISNEERFITREEAAKLLHVDFTTLWRWNKTGLLLAKKVGPRRVMYKYTDVLQRLNGEDK